MNYFFRRGVQSFERGQDFEKKLDFLMLGLGFERGQVRADVREEANFKSGCQGGGEVQREKKIRKKIIIKIT